MKLIASLNGSVAAHFSPEDVAPRHGVIEQYLIDFIGEAYQFSVRPVIPSGVPPAAIIPKIYQAGLLNTGNEAVPIIHLISFPNGYMIAASDTETADAILNDLTKRLDDELGFSFHSARQRRTYQSNIVVSFERGLEEAFEALAKIEKVLDSEIKRPNKPFKPKRFAFGFGEIAMPNGPIVMDMLENSDFVVERRALESYSENRYFCSAPVKSAEHMLLLQKIEDALRG